jgi:DNA-binding transcriptional ArsR family regulator
MVIGADDADEDQRRAEVFDALSHPTRIMILKALSEGALGFADLKKKLGIESSGHLQHHLNKLGGLAKTDNYGKYTLSDQGKDALLTVETVEKAAKAESWQNGKFHASKKNFVWKAAVIALALILTASLVLVAMENATLNNQASTFQNNLSKQKQAVTQLSKAVTQINTALSFSQAVLNTKKPQPQYLTTLTDGNSTKISLLSTDIGYFYGPNPWPLNETLREALTIPTDNGSILLPSFGWMFAPGNYSWIFSGGNGGNPYLMIGATVKNDYTSADAGNGTDPTAPIGNLRGTYLSYLSLTVKLYSQDGSIVQTTNLNVTYAPNNTALGDQKFISESGTTTQVIFYLSPSSLSIDHYEIYVSSISAYPPT